MEPAGRKNAAHEGNVALIAFEDRPSDLLLVDRVWRSHSEHAGTFHSMAQCNLGIVVSRVAGQTCLTVRGPETRATLADCPADGEWFGITFRLGTFVPLLPAGVLRDRNDVALPAASRRSFVLDGSTWEYPAYDDAETFVRRLVAKGLLAADPLVEDVLRGENVRLSQRTAQRRVLAATGMTPHLIHQVERARRAVTLLQAGQPIAHVAAEAGYFDQAHLTRSLRRFIGQSPLQIARGEQQLSLLYNTAGA